jgi:DNA-binding NarL/FixJ family response regulator
MVVSAASSDQWSRILSPREREIALLVAQGFADKKIALELELSPGTVKQHLHHIFMKLGIRTRKTLIVAHAQSSSRRMVRRSTRGAMSDNAQASSQSLEDEAV